MIHHSLKTVSTHIIILLVLALPFNCFSNQEITIVRGQNFPPYHYTDDNDKMQGFVIEIIEGTALDMGLKVSFKQYPWSRCINLVKKGDADAMMNLFKTQERELFMHFENNIIAYETNSFFSLANTKIQYDGDFSTVLSKKIGTIRNYSYGEKFDSQTFKKKLSIGNRKRIDQ